jgi:hypothetical protein
MGIEIQNEEYNFFFGGGGYSQSSPPEYRSKTSVFNLGPCGQSGLSNVILDIHKNKVNI